ncbi:MAG: hypothetical protein AB1894_23865 [Chloroflexota bacterium]
MPELPPFTPADELYALDRACVPEHVVALMAAISKGRPLRIGEYLAFSRDNWLTLVGYPLAGPFVEAECQAAIDQAVAAVQPDTLWFIGPQAPAALAQACTARSSDEYLQLELDGLHIKPALQRQAQEAAQALVVEREQAYTRQHKALVSEFMRRQELPGLVAALYRSMPDLLAGSSTACLLSAYTRRGKLSAFYVIETAARRFDAYILGCYSRQHYVAHASDLLFYQMIELARANRKPAINLGLGVSDGIRRFKRKWGGRPYLQYEFCEITYRPPGPLGLLHAVLEARR